MENKLIGKIYYEFYPEWCFGNLIFNYWEFEIIKLFPKSARVKTLKEHGKTHSDSVKVSELDSHYFKSLKQGIEWNRGYIQRSIDSSKKELEGYTKKNPIYEETQDTITLLTNYLCALGYETSDKFLEKLKDIDNNFQDSINKRAKFKKGDKVKILEGFKKGKVGTIYSVNVSMHIMKGLFDEKITYGVENKKGKWSSSNIGESKLQMEEKDKVL
jgi:hypothetical protein